MNTFHLVGDSLQTHLGTATVHFRQSLAETMPRLSYRGMEVLEAVFTVTGCGMGVIRLGGDRCSEECPIPWRLAYIYRKQTK